MTFNDLQKELIKAMKERNTLKKNTLANIVTRAKNIAIERKTKDNITEEIVTEAIVKEQKIIIEQISTCPDFRSDLLTNFKTSLEYVNEIAPKMMNEDETRKAVYHIISTIDIQNTGKGAIMKAVMPRLKGKADGKMINKIVTEIVQKSGE